MPGKPTQRDILRMYNAAQNLMQQAIVVSEQFDTSETVQQIIESISRESHTLLISMTRGGFRQVDIAAVDQELQQFESRLLELLHEQEVPITRMYVEDMQVDQQYCLAQEASFTLDVTKGGVTTVILEEGTLIELISEIGSEVQLKAGSTRLVLQRHLFPRTGLLVYE